MKKYIYVRTASPHRYFGTWLSKSEALLVFKWCLYIYIYIFNYLIFLGNILLWTLMNNSLFKNKLPKILLKNSISLKFLLLLIFFMWIEPTSFSMANNESNKSFFYEWVDTHERPHASLWIKDNILIVCRSLEDMKHDIVLLMDKFHT